MPIPATSARAVTACAVAALALASCDRPEPPTKPAGASLFDAAFTPGDCAAVPAFAPPAVGTLFSSHLTSAGGVEEEMEVLSTSGVSVSYSLVFVLKGGVRAKMSERAAHIGVLYDRVDSEPRRAFDYDSDPSIAYDLPQGGSRTFLVTERVTAEGHPTDVEHQFHVEMLGCGTLRWRGENVPVKVLKADIANASLDGAGAAESTARDVFTAYVAPQYGWPLLKIYADGSREEVQRVDRPAT